MPLPKTKLLVFILAIGLIAGAGVYAFFGRHTASRFSAAPSGEIMWLPASALPTRWAASRDFTWYSLQNNMIYCMGNPFPEADVATFVVSSLGTYGKDKNHAYWCSQEIAIADPSTFTVLNGEYGKDATHVVYGGYYLVPDADPATFSVIPGSSYAKDKNYVYDTWRELPAADPATFAIVSPNAARDKKWIYINDALFGPASLITDNTEYAKALPADCNPAGADPISPQPFPGAFSENENVIGYMSASRICVIDKKAGTVQSFPYGFADSTLLSKDGSKVLYFKNQSEGAVMNGLTTCADCGQYSLDRATGKAEKVSK